MPTLARLAGRVTSLVNGLGSKRETGRSLTLGELGSKLGIGSGKSGRSSSARLVTGLDIEPGQVIAAEVQLNGGVRVERAAGVPISSDVVRDGEVADVEALTEALRTIFNQHKLPRQVRVGVANQRIMVRMLEFPPITDPRELEAAVRFKAQDEIPMPPDTVVLDYHSLGVVDTVSGPRERVVLVAARRDMIERLVAAVEAAGLRPEGIDLSAFALIRSLHQPGSDPDEPVLYLHVSGLTNLVVARGVSCVFTRVLGTGLEAISTTVAERCVIPIDEARSLVFRVGLTSSEAGAAADRPEVSPAPVPALDQPTEPTVALATERALDPSTDPTVALATEPDLDPSTEPTGAVDVAGAEPGPSDIDTAGVVRADIDPAGVARADTPDPDQTLPGAPLPIEALGPEPAGAEPEAAEPVAAEPFALEPGAEEPEADSEISATDLERLMTVRNAVSDGLRLIVAEVRNSLDYHLGHLAGSSDRPVERVVLSGPALGVPGLLDALQAELKLPVVAGEVNVADGAALAGVPASRLAVAAGLAVSEVKP
ncbi:MAG TPA: pilus assembly protein PilM [Solirubrobacteraceae bacterium]|nr:pilus assembly protein PilM [Solirubrobacteraceae bacterium]